MRTGAGIRADQTIAFRVLRQYPQILISVQAAPEYHLIVAIRPVELKHTLSRISPMQPIFISDSSIPRPGLLIPTSLAPRCH